MTRIGEMTEIINIVPLQSFCAEMCKIYVIAFSWESLQITCFYFKQNWRWGGDRFSLKRYLCVFQGVEVVVSVWGPTGPGWLVPISMWFIATKEHRVGDGCHDEIDKHGEKIRFCDDNFLKPLAEVLFLLHFSNTSPLSIAYDRKQSEKLKIHQRTKIFNDQPSCQVFLEILGILVKGSERSRKITEGDCTALV